MSHHLKHLSTSLLFVDNIPESRDFYRTLLQRDPVEDLPLFCSFAIGPHHLNLHPADAKSPRSTGGCVAYWWSDDVSSFLTHATSVGAEIYRGPLEVPEVDRVICQIRDPFGNVLGVEGPLRPFQDHAP